MGITSGRLHELGLVDQVISEPLGGAHRNPELMAANLKKHLLETLDRLADLPAEELLERRYQRLMSYGVFED
jgi:acetyl-CoA carboxylase carboxyl transferase subunit alpha